MGLINYAQAEPTPILLPSGRTVEVPTFTLELPAWGGEPIGGTYGEKPLVDVEGEALFAELAALRLLQREGWDGVWVDSFGRRYLAAMPDAGEPAELPAVWRILLGAIVEGRSAWSGCWDVFAWRGGDVLFAEVRRAGEGELRHSRRRWLEAALDKGLALDAFMLVDWDFAAEGAAPGEPVPDE